jgi:hypothetical protein
MEQPGFHFVLLRSSLVSVCPCNFVV